MYPWYAAKWMTTVQCMISKHAIDIHRTVCLRESVTLTLGANKIDELVAHMSLCHCMTLRCRAGASYLISDLLEDRYLLLFDIYLLL